MDTLSWGEEVRGLYERLLEAWNRRDAAGMAELCAAGGAFIGFDGSEMLGGRAIQEALAPIFRDHPTGQYVSVVREVQALAADVVLLRAVAGLVPPDQTAVKPERNALQTVVAVRDGGEAPGAWRVALFQNTPAAFDGRPAARDELTALLNAKLANTLTRSVVADGLPVHEE